MAVIDRQLHRHSIHIAPSGRAVVNTDQGSHHLSERDTEAFVRSFGNGSFTVVAVAEVVEGKPFEFAAYVENDYTRSRGNSVEMIAASGTKLFAREGESIFPNLALTLSYRR